ncbi:MAG: hypothetical protein ABI134_11400 [Byssovorax sp.]
MATDNVIDLMLGKLHRLAPGTQRVLLLATCIGHEFDLATLSTIDERSPIEAAADLWEALREGLVVPLDSAYERGRRGCRLHRRLPDLLQVPA